MFEELVQTIPDHTAVVFKDKKYTYRELDEISDRLGKYIASQGIGSEDVVSILIPRCEYMAIAPMGVIKAGAASVSYTHLDVYKRQYQRLHTCKYAGGTGDRNWTDDGQLPWSGESSGAGRE